MEGVDYKPFTNAIKGHTASIRQRIERFTSRPNFEEETFEIKLLPLEESVVLDLTSDFDEIYMCNMFYPMLTAPKSIKDFTCKLWIENLAGEKTPESTRKLIFSLSKFYLVTSDEPEESDENNLIYLASFNFGRYRPSAFLVDDVAIVCFEISYRLSVEEFSSADSDLRRQLWEARNSDLSDLTLVVGEKEIKVSRIFNLLNSTF
jgi:hypothetical protein